MPETILLTIIAIAGALAGTLLGARITQKSEREKRISEEKRWYANFFFGREVDALHNLFATLVDCHYAMNYYANYRPATLEEFRSEVGTKLEVYLRAKAMASLFLDDEEEKIMAGALGAFRRAHIAILLGLSDKKTYNETDEILRRVDFTGLAETYEAAVACLRKRLNSDALENIRKS